MSPEASAAVTEPDSPPAMTWGWLLLIGLLSVIIGLFILLLPGITVATVGVLFGIFLLISGILGVVGSITRTQWSTLTRVVTGVTGLLSIGLGILSLRDELQSVLFLATWIGIGWILTGIARIVAGTESRTVGRGWLILAGIVIALAGVIVLIWPLTSLAALTYMAGWLLIVAGIVEVVEAVFVRRQ